MSTELVQRLDMNALISRAVEGNVAVETLERLLQLAKDVRAENAKAAWHKAMAQFQANVPEIKKTKIANAGNYKYAYAPLEECLSAVRPVLSVYGLSITFGMVMDSAQVTARCIVSHEEGHSEMTEFTIPIDLGSRMNTAQQVASASTYSRRYSLLAALGLAPEDDDDGAAAGEVVQPRTRHTVEPATAKPLYDETKNSDADYPPVKGEVREFLDDANRAVWRGTLLDSRDYEGTNKSGKPYKRWFFKGQDGKEFNTFSATAALGLLALVRSEVEITWKPGMKKDEYDILACKPASGVAS